MVNAHYLLAAENLVKENKNRLDKTRSPEEKETDELFYWILNQLEHSVQHYYYATNYHRVIIHSEGYSDYPNKVGLYLHNSLTETYLSKYVLRETFYNVMKNVANIFNEIGKSESNGYHFYATFELYETRLDPPYYPQAKLEVTMTTE